MAKASTEYKREHKADFGREKIEILYEDQWIVIINKPTGMLSVPYPGSHARTAIDVLEDMMRKNGTANAHHKPYVVHRLDRDTSGVMMFALSEQAQKKIMDTWQTMVTERLYHAVAENPDVFLKQSREEFAPLPDSGLIDDPLAFNAHNVGFVPKKGDKPSKDAPRMSRSNAHEESIYEKHITGSGENREFKTVEARTNFRVIRRGPTHTLFELSLDTGKKNQIRAHLASKGYPLAGDENYRAHTDPFNRLALHARTLEFVHPFTGKKMSFVVPEPHEWIEYVEKGDEHPAIPVWMKDFVPKNVHGSSHESANGGRTSRTTHGEGHKTSGRRFDDPAEKIMPDSFGAKRLSRKDKAHMNFIEQGKSGRK
jgi:23S rRNA pseudouridine1911/1915/1917 synthase